MPKPTTKPDIQSKKVKATVLPYKPSADLPKLANYGTEWDLSVYYKSENDPKINSDVDKTVASYKNFAKRWKNKSFATNPKLLKQALTDYEALAGDPDATRPGRYFELRSCLNAKDDVADKALTLIQKRLREASNEIIFFTLELGKIPKNTQRSLLKDKNLEHFHYFLKQIFRSAVHDLTEAEEKIVRLKSQPILMWHQLNDKLLSTKEIKWKGKNMALPEAIDSMELQKSSDKPKLWKLICLALEEFGTVSEHEFNATVNDTRAEDDLRKLAKPYSGTAIAYQHDEASIESFVETVTKQGFKLSKKFYELKASYHGVSKLHYSQKYDSIGESAHISFTEAVDICRDVYYKVNPIYGKAFDEILTNNQIDVYPKKGKTGGAFMYAQTGHPLKVMLNHTNTLKSLETIAHEMGHAIHSVRSDTNTPLYAGHTILTAETASTLFENLVFDAMYEAADDKTKLELLHDKIGGDIATVQRQIAFFNCELEIHNTIKEKGAMTHQEIKECMYRHLKSYLGEAIELTPDDGVMYIYLTHLRAGFYVYTYAFGHLISRVMASRYKENNNFRNEIDTFLTSGQSASAVDIYKKIGFDITSTALFEQALAAQAKDIETFKKLLKKTKTK